MPVPYEKYTSCVNPKDYIFPISGYTIANASVLLVVITTGLIFATSVVSVSLAIAADLALIIITTWYLYGRLICLSPQPVCAIGVVTGILHPNVESTAGKVGDNDATMGVLLAPGPTNLDDPDLDKYQGAAQGVLIKPNDAITGIGLGYTSDIKYIKQLHCEFEGSGIHDFWEFLIEILAFLIAILLLITLVPLAGPIITLLAILAALLGLGGLINIFLPGTRGVPTSEFNGQPGNLVSGNIVAVTGDWIYDSGHTGWNEIHAVHSCLIIPGADGVTPAAINPDGTWPSDIGGGLGLDDAHIQQTILRWCGQLGITTGVIFAGNVDNPANNWAIHPLIDGCQTPIIL